MKMPAASESEHSHPSQHPINQTFLSSSAVRLPCQATRLFVDTEGTQSCMTVSAMPWLLYCDPGWSFAIIASAAQHLDVDHDCA